ncbi:serine carboxypeptidase, putative [Ricinus communis]|uniref:Serine carboxypeptidase, putative n=1 Tax=Ricinus communis TaxID=3988 RepID=B9R6Y3_RICCO|nr:serine carboxypeptidase, putative [Ricinus communis]
MARVEAMHNLCLLSLMILLLQGWSQRVEFLPGYIGVDKSEDVQLFYYFVKSQGNAKEDPLLLWLTGGPGCSALSGLLYEIGPLHFKAVEYNGSLPTLILNPYSWTQVASIIFVDSPVGTGFSYARNQLASLSGDFRQIEQLDQFLRKWLIDHTEFLSNPVYVGGDSYSGMPLPPLVQRILNGNEEGSKPSVNLKGYLLGNAATDYTFDGNSQVPFAHGMGLISDELFESLRRTCGGEYVIIDPSNADCMKHMQEFNKVTSGLNTAQILEPLCNFAFPKPIEISFRRRRSLYAKSGDFADPDPSIPIGCRTYAYLLSKYWVNDKSVRKALHIREGSIGEWTRCNYGLTYTYEVFSAIKYHLYLGKKGYRSLIYSGDHDMLVPFVGTQAWIRSLNFSIVDDWQPWHIEGQVAGYTRSYSNQMTYATVKGGGHTAPEYKQAECFAMFKRWISREPL